jgi:hypothetical protein
MGFDARARTASMDRAVSAMTAASADLLTEAAAFDRDGR